MRSGSVVSCARRDPPGPGTPRPPRQVREVTPVPPGRNSPTPCRCCTGHAQDLVHHRHLARLRPGVGDRRPRARRQGRRDRARHLDARRPVDEVRRRAAAAPARRRPTATADFAAVERGPRPLRPPRRRGQQRRLRPVRLHRGAHPRPRPATRSRRTCSARCGSPRPRCRSCASRAAGHIIQVSSIGGITAFPNVGIYHASKWALEGFSQALAQEVADFGIHVTLIEPGGFATDWGGSSAKHATSPPGLRRRPREGRRAGAGRASASPGDPTASAAAILQGRRRREAAAAGLLRHRAAGHRQGRLRVPAGDLAGAASTSPSSRRADEAPGAASGRTGDAARRPVRRGTRG